MEKPKYGSVASGHELSSKAALDVLKGGGNAVDAAVAALLVSAVAEPSLTSLGGGGFATVKFGDDIRVADFFSNIPSSKPSPEDMDNILVDFGGTVQSYLVGENSLAVPGSVPGIFSLLEKYGSKDFSELAAPAVRYAEKGVRVNRMQAMIFNMLSPVFSKTEEVRRVYYPNGHAPLEGEKIYNHKYAVFLKRLAEEGLPAYLDEMRQFTDNFSTSLSPRDISSYSVGYSEPLETWFGDYKVHSPPPNSMGGARLSVMLRMFGFSGAEKFSHGSAEYISALARVMAGAEGTCGSKLINAFYEGGWQGLISDEEVKKAIKSGAGAGYASSNPLGNTTHISVLDRDGNAVSMTTTNGEGSGVMLGDTGVHLNNMLGEESLYGQNYGTCKGGERLSSMMAPTIVMNGRRGIELILGSGGSERIPTALFQVILNSVVHGLAPAPAVDFPRLHLLKEGLQAEPGFDREAVEHVEGVNISLWAEKSLYFGGVHVIDGRGKGYGDPRRGGFFVSE